MCKYLCYYYEVAGNSGGLLRKSRVEMTSHKELFVFNARIVLAHLLVKLRQLKDACVSTAVANAFHRTCLVPFQM